MGGLWPFVDGGILNEMRSVAGGSLQGGNFCQGVTWLTILSPAARPNEKFTNYLGQSYRSNEGTFQKKAGQT